MIPLPQHTDSVRSSASHQHEPDMHSPRGEKNLPGKLPLFSVVIPAYRVERYLETTLKSVYAQTETDFEIVVVDDGSPDGTAEILRRQTDPRLRVIRQANQGECSARNRGMREARGTYIALLDADDAWRPNHLELARQALEAYPEYGWYASRLCRVVAEELTAADFEHPAESRCLEAVNWYLEGCQYMLPSCVVMRRSVVEGVDLFPPRVKMYGDNIGFSRLCRQYPMILLSDAESMIYLDRTTSATGIYRQTGFGSSSGVELDALRLHQALAAEPGCSREARLMYRHFSLNNWWMRISSASLIGWLPEIAERRPLTGAGCTLWLKVFCLLNHIVCRAMRWGIRRRINSLRRTMDRLAAEQRVILKPSSQSSHSAASAQATSNTP